MNGEIPAAHRLSVTVFDPEMTGNVEIVKLISDVLSLAGYNAMIEVEPMRPTFMVRRGNG